MTNSGGAISASPDRRVKAIRAPGRAAFALGDPMEEVDITCLIRRTDTLGGRPAMVSRRPLLAFIAVALARSIDAWIGLPMPIRSVAA